MADTTDTPVAAPQPVNESNNTAANDSAPATSTAVPAAAASTSETGDKNENNSDRKRKHDGKSRTSRGGKRRDMGRKEYQANQPDRRARNEVEKQKPRDPNSHLPAPFASEEIAAEDRRPKRKVAVLIGYSGTGYKGMQINTTEKTIEGDLFTAFVKAGAISKANADDPKKSALVRCARTDKGVHAAGNMISLKLIIEDNDIVEKINEHLAPQIRVWGIERTIGSFSCYQSCDSRWYEYLLPSHCLLPPHPSSWLAKTLLEHAEEAGDMEGYLSRQEEVKDFWKMAEEEDIKPISDAMDADIKDLVLKALYEEDSGNPDADDANKADDSKKSDEQQPATIESAQAVDGAEAAAPSSPKPTTFPGQIDPAAIISASDALSKDQKKRVEAAVKSLKLAYNDAKRRHRIPQARIARLQEALTSYVGTRNYHNYTILKTFRDPSSKRMIKSFIVNPEPKIIQGTEWLSLKVHGQSFMMHQIRKMVGMASLVVRCGTPIDRIEESYKDVKMSIPKVPGLGLLLERPVFDSYNKLQATKHDRPQLDFGKWEEKLEAFKQKEIYQRIFEEEAKENTFHLFFNQIDNYRERHFLYLTSKGVEATKYPAGHESKNKAGQKARELADVKEGGAGGAAQGDKHKLDGESDDEGVTKQEVAESG